MHGEVHGYVERSQSVVYLEDTENCAGYGRGDRGIDGVISGDGRGKALYDMKDFEALHRYGIFRTPLR